MKRHRRSSARRLVSLALVVVLLLPAQLGPSEAVASLAQWPSSPAQESSPVGTASPPAENPAPPPPPAPVIPPPSAGRGDVSQAPGLTAEIKDRRTATSRTFGNRDGTFTTEVYPTPIHYQAAPGDWRDIVNELKPSSTAGFAFESTANRFKARFAPAAAGKPVSLELDGRSISFGLEQARQTQAVVERNRVTYAEVYPGVDLRLTVGSDRVKEELVLKQRPTATSFSFPLQMVGLTARQEADGTVGLYAGADRAMYIPNPYMYDSKVGAGRQGVTSNAIQMTLATVGNGPVLTLVPNTAWLSDPARVYPVVVDPTIVIQPDAATGKDSYITSLSPGWNCGSCVSIYVGRPSGDTRRGILYFDLSHINYRQVIYATLYLHLYQRHGTPQTLTVNVHRVTNAWTEPAVTWNSRDGSNNWTSPGGDYDSTPRGSFTIDASVSGNTWFNTDLTYLVNDWQWDRSTNYGMLLKLADEGITGTYYDFDPSDYIANWPKLEISYAAREGPQDGYGLEPYIASVPWDLGANTRLYAPFTEAFNLVLAKDMLSIPGRGGIGFDLSLVYNRRAGRSCTSTTTGSNWNLSLPTLRPSDDPSWLYLLNDPDGSKWYYANATPQGDGATRYQPITSGATYTLLRNDNLGRFVVEHDNGLTHELSTTQTIGNAPAGSTGYRLLRSYDGHHLQNTLTYTYDADGYITSITDSSNAPRSVTLAWQSGWCSNRKVLTSITEPAGVSANLYYLQAASGEVYLQSIVEAAGTPDARTTSFTYEPYDPNDPYARLTKVTDPRGNNTTIEYDATYPDKRVKRITDASGAYTSFSYHDNYDGTEDRMYVEDANGAITLWSRGTDSNHPTSIKAANLYNGSFERTDGFGNPDGWTFVSSGATGARDTAKGMPARHQSESPRQILGTCPAGGRCSTRPPDSSTVCPAPRTRAAPG